MYFLYLKPMLAMFWPTHSPALHMLHCTGFVSKPCMHKRKLSWTHLSTPLTTNRRTSRHSWSAPTSKATTLQPFRPVKYSCSTSPTRSLLSTLAMLQKPRRCLPNRKTYRLTRLIPKLLFRPRINRWTCLSPRHVMFPRSPSRMHHTTVRALQSIATPFTVHRHFMIFIMLANKSVRKPVMSCTMVYNLETRGILLLVLDVFSVVISIRHLITIPIHVV
mmetsp:Transcript_3777/g.7697  ORF Transcript_3777/g.7697 Transcript_3777/m.7697 type:complete len:219 (+) Transcript_3777:2254-2910(+)